MNLIENDFLIVFLNKMSPMCDICGHTLSLDKIKHTDIAVPEVTYLCSCGNKKCYDLIKYEEGGKRMMKIVEKKAAAQMSTNADAIIDAVNALNLYGGKIPYSNMYQNHGTPYITKVIYNNPATIVYWSDGTKTITKAHDEQYDPEKGLSMAITKKVLGNTGRYYNEIKKWLPKED